MSETYTLFIQHRVTMSVTGYSIEGVAGKVAQQMLEWSPKNYRTSTTHELVENGNGQKFHCITVSLFNMRGTLKDKAVVLGEQPAVATKQYHANSAPGVYISCRTCGSDHFYNVGRSRDYNHLICSACEQTASTLTETGASA